MNNEERKKEKRIGKKDNAMKQDRASKQCSALALYHIWIGKLVCLSIYDIEYSTKGAFDTLILNNEKRRLSQDRNSAAYFVT